MNRLQIDILSLFPDMFHGVLGSSILRRAQEKQRVDYRVIDFREYATDKHRRVDDYPYGGGEGMVLKPEPIFRAVQSLKKEPGRSADFDQKKPRIILMCPQGEVYDQHKAEELSGEDHLIFICGHYEGYDERIRQHLVTDEISIGDFVLTGGELPAMVVIDSVVRLRDGVLGNESSTAQESFSMGLLEYPQYTRPAQYQQMNVPDILLSGDHQRIRDWRHQQSLFRTWKKRPDLLEKYPLTQEEQSWLKNWEQKADSDAGRDD